MLILLHTSAIRILYRGNKMATEYLIACILFTIQIIEILRAKILKQILLRLFCRERRGVINSGNLNNCSCCECHSEYDRCKTHLFHSFSSFQTVILHLPMYQPTAFATKKLSVILYHIPHILARKSTPIRVCFPKIY